jgi:hypothetical protein
MGDPRDGDIWQIDLKDSRGHEQGDARPAIFIRCTKKVVVYGYTCHISKKGITLSTHS